MGGAGLLGRRSAGGKGSVCCTESQGCWAAARQDQPPGTQEALAHSNKSLAHHSICPSSKAQLPAHNKPGGLSACSPAGAGGRSSLYVWFCLDTQYFPKSHLVTDTQNNNLPSSPFLCRFNIQVLLLRLHYFYKTHDRSSCGTL